MSVYSAPLGFFAIISHFHATEDDDTGKRIVSFVLDKYGSQTGVYLSNLTHKVGSPWHQVRERYEGRVPRNTPIPNELIKDYFFKLVVKA